MMPRRFARPPRADPDLGELAGQKLMSPATLGLRTRRRSHPRRPPEPDLFDKSPPERSDPDGPR
jgi:hypothetical protein